MSKLTSWILVSSLVFIAFSSGSYGQQTTSTPPNCGDRIVQFSENEKCDLGASINGSPDSGCSATCQIVSGWTCLYNTTKDFSRRVKDQDPNFATSTRPLSMSELWLLLTNSTQTTAQGNPPPRYLTHISDSDARTHCLPSIDSGWENLCNQYIIDINAFKDMNLTIPVKLLSPVATCTQGSTKLLNYNLATKQPVTDYMVKCDPTP
ncbi:MAG: hypothetical protein KBD64_07785 [Gammaproteobacteria bacterium]|nr:hypothetical protein [Gammaproteobacteria bacterium]